METLKEYRFRHHELEVIHIAILVYKKELERCAEIPDCTIDDYPPKSIGRAAAAALKDLDPILDKVWSALEAADAEYQSWKKKDEVKKKAEADAKTGS